MWTKAFLIVWDSDQGFLNSLDSAQGFSNSLDLAQGFSNSWIWPMAFLVILYWSFCTGHLGWSFWTVILNGHFGWSFSVVILSVIFGHWKLYSDPNFGAIAVEILSTADCGYYSSYSKDYLIMDGDSIDSGQDSCRLVGNDPEPDILLELEWRSHGGSGPSGGASTQASVQSRGTFWVLSIIGGGSAGSCSIIPMGNYFNDTTRRSCWMVLAWKVFAQRVNVDIKDHATIVGITWLPQLPFQISLVRQSIFVPRTRTASYPTNIRTFNPSMLETWISWSFSGNAWKHLICLIPFLFLPGLTQTPSVCWIAGMIGGMIGLTWQSTDQSCCLSMCVPGRGILLIGVQMRTIWLAWSRLKSFSQSHVILIWWSVLRRSTVVSLDMNREGSLTWKLRWMKC